MLLVSSEIRCWSRLSWILPRRRLFNMTMNERTVRVYILLPKGFCLICHRSLYLRKSCTWQYHFVATLFNATFVIIFIENVKSFMISNLIRPYTSMRNNAIRNVLIRINCLHVNSRSWNYAVLKCYIQPSSYYYGESIRMFYVTNEVSLKHPPLFKTFVIWKANAIFLCLSSVD